MRTKYTYIKYIFLPCCIFTGFFSSIAVAVENSDAYDIPPLGTLFSTPEERDDIDAQRVSGGVVDKEKKRRTIDTVEEKIASPVSVDLKINGLIVVHDGKGNSKNSAWVNGHIVRSGKSLHGGPVISVSKTDALHVTIKSKSGKPKKIKPGDTVTISTRENKLLQPKRRELRKRRAKSSKLSSLDKAAATKQDAGITEEDKMLAILRKFIEIQSAAKAPAASKPLKKMDAIKEKKAVVEALPLDAVPVAIAE